MSRVNSFFLFIFKFFVYRFHGTIDWKIHRNTLHQNFNPSAVFTSIQLKKDYQKADRSNVGMAQKNCIETSFKHRQNVIPTITCVKPAFTCMGILFES